MVVVVGMQLRESQQKNSDDVSKANTRTYIDLGCNIIYTKKKEKKRDEPSYTLATSVHFSKVCFYNVDFSPSSIWVAGL